MAIKVKVRKREISNGRDSIYLDYYPAIPHPKNGRLTRRESLNMYVFQNPKNPLDKKHNKETLILAEQIRQKRENELNKPEVYTPFEKEQVRLNEIGETNFVEYFDSLVKKRKGTNYDNWTSASIYLHKFSNGVWKFSDLNLKKCVEFREYLLTTKGNKRTKYTLSTNSALSYFNKFKATLKQAFKDGYLNSDLNGRIEPIKPEETHRNFLSLEELNILVQTDCHIPSLKIAALFSALTGLRFSDISKLIWSEITFRKGDGYTIQFKQKKTNGAEVLPISEQAMSLLGERQKSNQKVFPELKYSAYNNKFLHQWIEDAGINKKITFHSFRHSYATLQISGGTDIYTVSKLLGHRNLKTTQLYAKVVDASKRIASERIKLKF